MTDINNQIKELINQRLAKGQKTYGHGVQLEDTRDFTQEALEEVLDTAVYTAAKLLQLKHGKENTTEELLKSLKVGSIFRLYFSSGSWVDYIIAINNPSYAGGPSIGLFYLDGNLYKDQQFSFSSCRRNFEEFIANLTQYITTSKYKIKILKGSEVGK